MVTIRLSRGGAKKRPFYHLVVTDSRSRRDSCYIEQVGYFNPFAVSTEKGLEVQLDRIDHWLGHGAKPSERVSTLIKKARKEISVVEAEAAA